MSYAITFANSNHKFSRLSYQMQWSAHFSYDIMWSHGFLILSHTVSCYLMLSHVVSCVLIRQGQILIWYHVICVIYVMSTQVLVCTWLPVRFHSVFFCLCCNACQSQACNLICSHADHHYYSKEGDESDEGQSFRSYQEAICKSVS